MDGSQLSSAVATRFYAVNGFHLMTAEDDAYASEWYVELEALAETAGIPASELRRLMLANRLPLPSYIRSDGTQMVANDLLDLVEAAGGSEELPKWFAEQCRSAAEAVCEWDDYLSGRYVCLRSVAPSNMRRKNDLCTAIAAELSDPAPDDEAWLKQLHILVDELDAIEPPFAPYDRL